MKHFWKRQICLFSSCFNLFFKGPGKKHLLEWETEVWHASTRGRIWRAVINRMEVVTAYLETYNLIWDYFGHWNCIHESPHVSSCKDLDRAHVFFHSGWRMSFTDYFGWTLQVGGWSHVFGMGHLRVWQAEVPTDTSASLEQATGAFACSYETQNHVDHINLLFHSSLKWLRPISSHSWFLSVKNHWALESLASSSSTSIPCTSLGWSCWGGGFVKVLLCLEVGQTCKDFIGIVDD